MARFAKTFTEDEIREQPVPQIPRSTFSELSPLIEVGLLAVYVKKDLSEWRGSFYIALMSLIMTSRPVTK